MSLFKPATFKPAMAALAVGLFLAPTLASAAHHDKGDMRMHHRNMHKAMHDKMRSLGADERKVVYQRWRQCSATSRAQKLRGAERNAFKNECRMRALG